MSATSAAGPAELAAVAPAFEDLRISSPDEPAEQEAVRRADMVVGAGTAPIGTAHGELPSASGDTTDDHPFGGGQPIDPATRGFMESRLGHDFSTVRVHTDARADEAAHAAGARAFTVGRDIVFAAGRYVPHTTTGRHTLAHELTHVTQQSTGGVAQIQREPEASLVADPTRFPLAPIRPKMDEVERNWMAEINPGQGPEELKPITLYIDSSAPAPLFDLATGTVDTSSDPEIFQRVTRPLAWNTMRSDLKTFEANFNAMVPPHNLFYNAQKDESLKDVATLIQLPGPKQQMRLPEVAGKQQLAGAAPGQTLSDAFTDGALAKPGDAKALQEMADSPEIVKARNELKVAQSALEASVSHAGAAAQKMSTAAAQLKATVLHVELEEAKDEQEESKTKLKELSEKKEAAAKKAEALLDIAVNLVKSVAGDEEAAAKAGEKAVEGGLKLAIGAVAGEIADKIYGDQIEATTKALAENTIAVKKLTKKAQQADIEAGQAAVDAAHQDFSAAKADVARDLNGWRAALSSLGMTMAQNTKGATDPAERKRIAGLIGALPVVNLVASRAAELRMVCFKAQDLPYSMASGYGFGILTAHDPKTADTFIRNADILVGVTQEAMAAESEWKDRAKSIQSMIDQIGQGPGLPENAQ